MLDGCQTTNRSAMSSWGSTARPGRATRSACSQGSRGLLEVAHDVDLLVVGLHERSPLGRLLHGRTTAEGLMRAMPRSLLAVPDGSQRVPAGLVSSTTATAT